MAPANNHNIWSEMGYTAPRGMCNHKDGLLSPKCPCQRFMIHPLKVSTSFECDGCSHHASFHDMENRVDDAIVKRWQAIEEEKQGQNGDVGPRKRPRKAIEGASTSNSTNVFDAINGSSQRPLVEATRPRANLRSRKKQSTSQQFSSLKSTSRIIDLSESGEAESEKESYRTGSWVD